MSFCKKALIVCLILIMSVFTLGFGKDLGSHGSKGSTVKSGGMTMHQMGNLPLYDPPEELNESAHDDIKIFKYNRRFLDKPEVERFLAQFKIILLRLEKEQLLPENAERLKTWVENGGTLWLDDGWSAAKYFGIEQEISQSALHFSREFDSIKKDPLMTGVSGLAYLNGYYMIPNDSFTEVIRVDDRVYLAYKELGKGKLIYYPGSIIVRLDYYRYNLNLREFSAGYEIPALVGDEIKNHNWDDE